MTFVGHCITGTSIGLFLISPRCTNRQLLIGVVCCAIAANFPDLKIKHWGHDDYLFSHSLFVNCGIIASITLVMALMARPLHLKVHWRIISALSLAWLSHLLLDTFYNHGFGLKMFWPLSNTSLAFPIPWFHTIDVSAGYLAWHNLQEFILELASFSLLAIAACFLRWRILNSISPNENPKSPAA
jgi:hypothetical protein